LFFIPKKKPPEGGSLKGYVKPLMR